MAERLKPSEESKSEEPVVLPEKKGRETPAPDLVVSKEKEASVMDQKKIDEFVQKRIAEIKERQRREEEEVVKASAAATKLEPKVEPKIEQKDAVIPEPGAEKPSVTTKKSASSKAGKWGKLATAVSILTLGTLLLVPRGEKEEEGSAESGAKEPPAAKAEAEPGKPAEEEKIEEKDLKKEIIEKIGVLMMETAGLERDIGEIDKTNIEEYAIGNVIDLAKELIEDSQENTTRILDELNTEKDAMNIEFRIISNMGLDRKIIRGEGVPTEIDKITEEIKGMRKTMADYKKPSYSVMPKAKAEPVAPAPKPEAEEKEQIKEYPNNAAYPGDTISAAFEDHEIKERLKQDINYIPDKEMNDRVKKRYEYWRKKMKEEKEKKSVAPAPKPALKIETPTTGSVPKPVFSEPTPIPIDMSVSEIKEISLAKAEAYELQQLFPGSFAREQNGNIIISIDRDGNEISYEISPYAFEVLRSEAKNFEKRFPIPSYKKFLSRARINQVWEESRGNALTEQIDELLKGRLVKRIIK